MVRRLKPLTRAFTRFCHTFCYAFFCFSCAGFSRVDSLRCRCCRWLRRARWSRRTNVYPSRTMGDRPNHIGFPSRCLPPSRFSAEFLVPFPFPPFSIVSLLFPSIWVGCACGEGGGRSAFPNDFARRSSSSRRLIMPASRSRNFDSSLAYDRIS